MTRQQVAEEKKRLEQELKQNEANTANHLIGVAREIIETRPSGNGVNWQNKALCSALDPELFDVTGLSDTQIEIAKRVCAACDVSEQCFAYAMNLDSGKEGSMIWAGLEPTKVSKERARIARAALRRSR